MSDQVARLLRHPLILESTWRRVQEWYRSGELAPQPELIAWETAPEEYLPQLGEALADGSYKPHTFRLLPYPKKGGALRHYCQPSVKDQVAFGVFGVLLAPLLEQQMPNLSFGNRWYRALARDFAPETGGKWKNRPYTLSDGQFYQPYRRGHGLFRRVAHWAATAMLKVEQDPSAAAGDHIVLANDYAQENLPPFIREEWWNGEADVDGRRLGFWANFDVRLAYPSVVIDVLEARLLALLDRPFQSDDWLEGYPTDVRAALTDPEVRGELGKRLIKLLRAVDYYEGDYPDLGLFWVPHLNSEEKESLPALLPHQDGHSHPGLPTGLNVSGLLLNVYLQPVDQSMNDWLNSTSGQGRIAFVRFADDMILLANSIETLLEGVDRLWQALAGNEHAVLSQPMEFNPANLRVNWSKLQPSSLGKIVTDYKAAQHVESLRSWWDHLSLKQKELYELGMRRDALKPHRLGRFVTHLVERLSGIGFSDETVRFGVGRGRRLVELHQLVRLDIQDQQVRADTRLAFAVNKLARAWLDEENTEEERRQVLDIRRSVQEALLLAPWKIKLWRAIVRVAVRRPHVESDEKDDESAVDWLEQLLSFISMKDNPHGWGKDGEWPEENDSVHRPDGRWKQPYLSALRAEFWRSVTETLHDLQRVLAHSEDPDNHWTTYDWTFRAIPEEQAAHLIGWLGNLERWANALYEQNQATLPSLEREALVLAILATKTTTSLTPEILDWSLTQRTRLVVPPHWASAQLAKLAGWSDVDKATAHWELLGFARRDLDSRPVAKKLQRAYSEHRDLRLDMLRIARTLQVEFSDKEAGYWSRRLPVPTGEETEREAAFWAYRKYHRIRELVLSHGEMTGSIPRKPTLHRLLWAKPHLDAFVKTSPSPSDQVRLGLPIPIACRMLADAIRWTGVNHNLLPRQPMTWLLQDGQIESLVAGRRRQLGLLATDYLPWPPHKEGPLIEPAADEWEVPPHPLLLALTNSRIFEWSSTEQRVIVATCHVLLFLTALDGSESLLDRMFERGPSAIPFEERWDLRNRFHLPERLWKGIDRLLRLVLLSWGTYSIEGASEAIEEIEAALGEMALDSAIVDAFEGERIDVRLEYRHGFELPRAVTLFSRSESGLSLPEELRVTVPQLQKELKVRLAQVKAFHDWQDLLKRKLCARRKYRQQIMAEVAGFLSPEIGGPAPEMVYGERLNQLLTTTKERPVELIIFPEALIPIEEERYFERLARGTGIAVLAGFLWRVLQRAAGRGTKGERFFVNEAQLHVPVADTVNPPLYRKFQIWKPSPAHSELALAQALTQKRQEWRMLPGRRWYRFVHTRWGDFTVAVCSDLIDPGPWNIMRGELLHLFQCAFNPDVELFRSLTWVRAYENYVNVVSTNHGFYGGSFVWTPRSGNSKTVAHLEGNRLSLAADVVLPVSELLNQQIIGPQLAIDRHKKEWLSKKNKEKQKYKSPPPEYRRKC